MLSVYIHTPTKSEQDMVTDDEFSCITLVVFITTSTW